MLLPTAADLLLCFHGPPLACAGFPGTTRRGTSCVEWPAPAEPENPHAGSSGQQAKVAPEAEILLRSGHAAVTTSRPSSQTAPPMKIVACNSNRPLAEAVALNLGMSLTQAQIRRFADMEVFVEILENVRGEDVFVIQSTSFPANDNLMELLITLDALRRSSARRITAVVPYFGYARQDRKSGSRTPISAKLVANLITEAGANRVLTMDLHAGQIQGFFDIPVDNLFAAPLFARDIQEQYSNRDLMIVSPDVGGVVRARLIASRLNCDLAIIDKRRQRAGHSEVMNVIGDVEGRDCLMIDDIVDSGGTHCNAAFALMEHGARSAGAYVTAWRTVRWSRDAGGRGADGNDDDHRIRSGNSRGGAGAQYKTTNDCPVASRSDAAN